MSAGKERGCLLVVSGPSGSGKTSLVQLALERLERLAFSVSWTSRPPRGEEQDGVDYCFVSRERFMEAVDRDCFLEHAEVHGNLYGTAREAVEQLVDNGTDVLLDIDVQGAEQVRSRLEQGATLEAVTVFIIPPDRDELERRLRQRKTDSKETIRTRLQNSLDEIARAGEFDHVLINGDLEECYRQFACIVTAARTRAGRMRGEISESFSARSGGERR